MSRPIVIAAGIAAGLSVARLAWQGRALVLDHPGARSQATRAVRGILRDWGPAILIMWLFQSLEPYIGVIRQTSIDDVLYRADLWLFGVEPTVWLSRHSTPLVTDSMALAYGSYFITPMIPRLWFRIVLVVVGSLWISVVYLRHHWIVDMFAGFAGGAVSNYLAPILRMRWPKLAHGS